MRLHAPRRTSVRAALQLRPNCVQLALHQQQLAADPLVAARGSPTADLYVVYALSLHGRIRIENAHRETASIRQSQVLIPVQYLTVLNPDWNQPPDDLTRIGNRTCMNPIDPRDARVARVYMRQLR